MPVAHTPVPMLYGWGHLGRELRPVALSQFIHETMALRYVLWPDRAARGLPSRRDRNVTSHQIHYRGAV